MANRSHAVFNETALSSYLATNSGYNEYMEGRAGNSMVELRIRARAKTVTLLPRAIGARLTSTSMKPTHCLPSTIVYYTIIVYLEYCWYA